MLYLLETKLSEKKSIFFALTQVYGIGRKTAMSVCRKVGLSSNLKISDITHEQSTDIVKTIDLSNVLLNNHLKNFKSLKMSKLVNMKSYRGLRFVKGLPVRGQRTRTNGKSSKTNKSIVRSQY